MTDRRTDRIIYNSQDRASIAASRGENQCLMVSCRELSHRSEESWTTLAALHEMSHCHPQQAVFHHQEADGETLLVVDGNATFHGT